MLIKTTNKNKGQTGIYWYIVVPIQNEYGWIIWERLYFREVINDRLLGK
jgi:hypothetical protein